MKNVLKKALQGLVAFGVASAVVFGGSTTAMAAQPVPVSDTTSPNFSLAGTYNPDTNVIDFLLNVTDDGGIASVELSANGNTSIESGTVYYPVVEGATSIDIPFTTSSRTLLTIKAYDTSGNLLYIELELPKKPKQLFHGGGNDY